MSEPVKNGGVIKSMEPGFLNQGIADFSLVKYQIINITVFEDHEAQLRILCHYVYNHLKFGHLKM